MLLRLVDASNLKIKRACIEQQPHVWSIMPLSCKLARRAELSCGGQEKCGHDCKRDGDSARLISPCRVVAIDLHRSNGASFDHDTCTTGGTCTREGDTDRQSESAAERALRLECVRTCPAPWSLTCDRAADSLARLIGFVELPRERRCRRVGDEAGRLDAGCAARLVAVARDELADDGRRTLAVDVRVGDDATTQHRGERDDGHQQEG